jgi:pantoate--beta-alanine ligase
MSSRNQYLSPELRERAPALYRSLQHGEHLIREGETDVERIVDAIWDKLEEAGISSIDYVAVADPHSLEALNEMRLPLVLLAAVRLGSTRLIDNCIVSASH